MNIYKITYGDTSILFVGTDSEAQSKASELSGTYQLYAGQGLSSTELKLKDQISFGNRLWVEFLKDNRETTSSITPSQSIQLDSEFSVLEKSCLRGDISTLEYLLPNVTVDGVIITQARKDKYIQMIQEYRANEL